MIPVLVIKNFCKFLCIRIKIDSNTMYMFCNNKLTIYTLNCCILLLCKKLLCLLCDNLLCFFFVYRKCKWKVGSFLLKLPYFHHSLKNITCLPEIICFLYHIHVCTLQADI